MISFKNKVLGLIFLLSMVGCLSLDAVRERFYSGSDDRPEERLSEINPNNKDSVLMYMERGTMRQSRGEYELSAEDYIAAADRLKELETYSVSKGASSLLINDSVQSFVGSPYERTLLHVFTALDHLSIAHWENAAVESRKIEATLDPRVRGDYPDIAFARYIAGFGFEMIDDYSNAAVQYKIAGELLENLQIDEYGAIVSDDSDSHDLTDDSSELLCVVLMGRTSKGKPLYSGAGQHSSPYATISIGDKVLGKSYNVSRTFNLIDKTNKVTAALKTAKVAGRIAVKESVAVALENNGQHELAGLARIALIGLLEQPDLRRWETLPSELQIARVPCPKDLSEFNVTINDAYNQVSRTIHVTNPITKRRNIFFSLVRNLP